ncbi:unnamed protein product [Ceutorhynchus assimilis]|uniref:Uncharacterized protein n=1 Tax=Ceutorhynchus assimilis TaxID=467358 RepID=A0A9N9MYJ2_9CUCU|nr:unnamed protein product [Ceutorhynchus assimilis]
MSSSLDEDEPMSSTSTLIPSDESEISGLAGVMKDLVRIMEMNITTDQSIEKIANPLQKNVVPTFDSENRQCNRCWDAVEGMFLDIMKEKENKLRKWISAKVLKTVGINSYLVMTSEGRVRYVHADHLKPSVLQPPDINGRDNPSASEAAVEVMENPEVSETITEYPVDRKSMENRGLKNNVPSSIEILEPKSPTPTFHTPKSPNKKDKCIKMVYSIAEIKMVYSIGERVELISIFFANHESAFRTADILNQRHPGIHVNRNYVLELVHKLRETGSVCNKKRDIANPAVNEAGEVAVLGHVTQDATLTIFGEKKYLRPGIDDDVLLQLLDADSSDVEGFEDGEENDEFEENVAENEENNVMDLDEDQEEDMDTLEEDQEENIEMLEEEAEETSRDGVRNEDLDWESDDDLPLSVYKAKLAGKNGKKKSKKSNYTWKNCSTLDGGISDSLMPTFICISQR